MLEFIQKIRRTFSPKEKWGMCFLILLLFFGSLLELAGVGTVLPVIAAFVSPGSVKNMRFVVEFAQWAGFSGDIRGITILLCGASVLFFLLKNLILFLINSWQIRFSYRISGRIAEDLTAKYLRAPLSFHVRNGASDTLELVIQTRLICTEVLTSVTMLISEGMLIFFSFLAIFWIAPGTALQLLLIVAVFGTVLTLAIRKYLAEASARVFPLETAANRFVLEAISSIREVKVSGRLEEFLKTGGALQREVIRNDSTLFAFQQLPRFLIEAGIVTVGIGMTAVLLLFGGDLSNVALQVSFIGLILARLMPSFSRIQYYTARIRGKLDMFYRVCRDLSELPAESPEGKKDITLGKELKLENLTFSHGGKKVLDNVTLTVPAKSSLALVGPTGCGKSTMLDLIAGLLVPESGRITADGTDIRDNMELWRRKIGYVPQITRIFDASVMENVALGVPLEKIDRQRVAECLEIAQALTFAAALPRGLDTNLGDAGARLSGGQRQRIGIARALYPDPEVLLLDEATSALDQETEASFVQALESISGKYTLIIAAHRLSTVKNCSAVYRFR